MTTAPDLSTGPTLKLRHAVGVLRSGGVVVHATEGVWGFACDPQNPDAIDRVLRLKQRSVTKGLILIGASSRQFAEELNAISPEDRERVQASWPGRVTWILPDRQFGPLIAGSHGSVACRVPGHAQARQLCEQFGGPLVSTSANRGGLLPALTYLQARLRFARAVDYVLPGKTSGAPGPSEIRDLSGTTVREASP